MRIDKYLFEKGFAQSRQKAKETVEAGLVYIDGKAVNKPSYEFDPETKTVEVKGKPYVYVSRGGVKLEHALKSFNISVDGLVCADIGSSTGGFTDCLLRSGAKKVFAIDSGTDQLHESLRDDSRIVIMENFNARNLSVSVLGETVNIAVCDLSFISQTHIYAPVADILKDSGLFVSLIKPQFEAGREHLSKGGIVRDKKVHKRVIDSLIASASSHRLYCKGLAVSPIQGGDGNTEYLALFEKSFADDISGYLLKAGDGLF